jgi:transcriptional regulator with XRE-family HTH domain
VSGVEFTNGKRPGVQSEDEEMTDGPITGAQAFLARRLLGLTQLALARRAATSKTAIGDFERTNHASSVLNVGRLRKAFEAAGIEFPEGEPPRYRIKRATWNPPPPQK